MNVTINEGASFVISNELGDIVPGKEAGLYSQDTRFLNRYEMFVNNVKPTVLTGRQVDYYSAVHYLTNAELDGIRPNSITIARKRIIGDVLHEDLEVINNVLEPIHIKLRFEFDTDFADIFEVKENRKPTEISPEFFINKEDKSLSFRYQSEDFYRETKIIFSQTPELGKKMASFEIKLEPEQRWEICIDFSMHLNWEAVVSRYRCDPFSMVRKRPEGQVEWIRKAPKLFTDYDILEHAYMQSLTDMISLHLKEPRFKDIGIVPAAGIPWFVTCFGRDSLITAYQTLPYLPDMAYGVLRNSARYQGREEDIRTEEEPGKIFHEIRWGRFSTVGETPYKIYYGTVDATPLFIILLSELYKWTADKAFIESLRDSLLRALEWIDEYGDKDNDGYIEYEKMGKYGLDNQGWKDSWDSVRFADGSFAEAPIALCEAQGYVYMAKLGAAELLEVLGDSKRADQLRKEAAGLKEKFNRDFWMQSKGFFAEALDKDKRQVDSITSNAGQLLWSGIVDEEKADILRQRLFSPDMFSGWGIRTMSSQMAAYNPVSYHNGTIWPHDNAIIAKGLMNYGFYGESLLAIDSILDAGQYFAYQRLPELFGGFDRKSSVVPIDYPTSSSPQAWASGASFLMLSTILGMRVDVDKKLLTLKPRFPADIYRVHLAGLRVGDSYISFEVLKERGRNELNITENPGSFKIKLERWPDEHESGYRKTGTER